MKLISIPSAGLAIRSDFVQHIAVRAKVSKTYRPNFPNTSMDMFTVSEITRVHLSYDVMYLFPVTDSENKKKKEHSSHELTASELHSYSLDSMITASIEDIMQILFSEDNEDDKKQLDKTPIRVKGYRKFLQKQELAEQRKAAKLTEAFDSTKDLPSEEDEEVGDEKISKEDYEQHAKRIGYITNTFDSKSVVSEDLEIYALKEVIQDIDGGKFMQEVLDSIRNTLKALADIISND
jgi:hypothetical protein